MQQWGCCCFSKELLLISLRENFRWFLHEVFVHVLDSTWLVSTNLEITQRSPNILGEENNSTTTTTLEFTRGLIFIIPITVTTRTSGVGSGLEHAHDRGTNRDVGVTYFMRPIRFIGCSFCGIVFQAVTWSAWWHNTCAVHYLIVRWGCWRDKIGGNKPANAI